MNNSSPQKVIILVLGLVLFFRCILPYFCNSVIVNEQFAETESEETEGEGPVVKDINTNGYKTSFTKSTYNTTYNKK